MNFKVYVHETRRCKVPHENIMNPRFLVKNGILSSAVDSDVIEGVFSKYCKSVQIEETKIFDFYFPDASLAIKRYSIEEFHAGMKARGKERSEIDETALSMKLKFDRVAVLISGLPSVHASEVLDVVSPDIDLKIRQIIGFTASLAENHELDGCFCLENDAELAYWSIKKASSIIKARRKP